jgi:hypothetical protein
MPSPRENSAPVRRLVDARCGARFAFQPVPCDRPVDAGDQGWATASGRHRVDRVARSRHLGDTHADLQASKGIVCRQALVVAASRRVGLILGSEDE